MTEPEPPDTEATNDESADTSELLRIAREDDVHTRKSMVRFILAVTLGFLLAVVVMGVGVSIKQMWLFYLGMGFAVLVMFVIRIRL